MIVDTNVLVRYFTNDDKKKASRFRSFLISGEKIELLDVVVAELYWTLRSFYKFPKEEILLGIEALVGFKAVRCARKELKEVIGILRKGNISFIDAYSAAYARLKYKGQVMSYDKDFDKLPGIKRVEP